MDEKTANQQLANCARCNELGARLDRAAQERGFAGFASWWDAGRPEPRLLGADEGLCEACEAAVAFLQDAEMEAEARAAGFSTFEQYAEHEMRRAGGQPV